MKTKRLFLLLLFFNTAFLVSQEQESPQEKGITLERYVVFLNHMAANDCFHLYENGSKQILRWGEPGNYHYQAIQQLDAPMLLLSWSDVMRYGDWCSCTEVASFGLQSFVYGRSMKSDPELKSNGMTFQLVNLKVCQASLEESAIDAGIDEIIEWLIAGAVIGGVEGVRRPETEGTAVTTESKPVSEKTKREPALTLEDYQQILQQHPEASRFVIQKNKESNSLSLSRADENNADKKKFNFENKEITERLKTLLKQSHRPEEEIEKIFPRAKRQEVCPALSAASLRQALALPVQAISQLSNKYKELVARYQDHLNKAQKATEDAEEIRAKLHEQDHDWYVTLIEKYQFRLADISAAEARVAEILKEAEDRIEQCIHLRLGQPGIKEPLDSDIAILEKQFTGCSSISQDIQMANKAYRQFSAAITSNDGSLGSVAEETEKQWKKIESDTQRVNIAIKSVQRSLQEDLQHVQETYNLYQEGQNKLLSELSRQQKIATSAWESVFSLGDEYFDYLLEDQGGSFSKSDQKFFRIKNAERLEVKKTFQNKNQELKKTKIFFEEEEKAAATCLEDRRIYFFQEENQRLRSLDTMSCIWSQKIEELSADSDEIGALREAVEAIKALKDAEQRLTRATQMQKKSHESTHSNAWASDALKKDFIEKRNEASTAHKKAIDAEKELATHMKHVQESYCDLNKFLVHPLPAVAEQKAVLERLINSWRNIEGGANASRDEWQMAAAATRAVKDAKIAWAKNILRLAAMGTGSFSLGKATKKEGELLGKLWIGLNPKWEEKDHQIAQEIADKDDYFSGKKYGEFLSHDQLKRLRTLSYKPKHKEYQINFEHRSTDKKDWDEKEADGSSTWGNGHLTITNPYADDSLEDSISLRYVELASSQHHESIYAHKATELIERAEHLNREVLKKQGRLEEVRSELRVAICEEKEIEHCHAEIAAIEQELPVLWQHVFTAYQEGLKIAPKEKKEWWFFQQERVRVQEKLAYSNRGKEILDNAIQWGVRQDDRYAEEMAKHTRVLRLIPLEKDALREYWNQKITSLKQKWEEEQSRLLYYQAERAQYHLLDLVQKAAEGSCILDLQNSALQAWDKAIAKFKSMLDNYRAAPSKVRSCWKSGLEVSQYEKGKLSLSQPAFEAVKQEHLAKQVLRQVDENLKSLDDAIAESEKEIAAWNKALKVCQEALRTIPASRKEFYFWWDEQYRLIEAKKNRATIRNFTNKGNKAQKTTFILWQQAQQSGEIKLWDSAINQNREATKWMQRACEKVKECLEGPHAASYPGEEKNLAKLQIVLKYYSIRNCILEAYKAAAIARGFQKSITHNNTEEVKRHFSDALEKWEQAIEQLTQIVQKDALCDSNLQQRCKEDLRYSWDQKLQCIRERDAL